MENQVPGRPGGSPVREFAREVGAIGLVSWKGSDPIARRIQPVATHWNRMTDAQLYLAVGLPVFAIVMNIMAGMMQMNALNNQYECPV